MWTWTTCAGGCCSGMLLYPSVHTALQQAGLLARFERGGLGYHPDVDLDDVR